MSIVHDDNLPAGMKARQKLAHEIAEQVCTQIWNISIDENEKLGIQITGNEALSYMGTILIDFSARWIVHMNRIRIRDDAGVTEEELIKNILNGILASINCVDSFEDDSPLPDGIKRLQKESDNE